MAIVRLDRFDGGEVTVDGKPVTLVHTGRMVRAGAVPFRTQRGLDILPIEAEVCFKRKLAAQPE